MANRSQQELTYTEVPLPIPILDLRAQYATYKSEALRAISEVCESQSFALGPAVAAFEEQIRTYLECKYAIGVSSGTDALLVSLMALNIKPGDEVITTPFSFFSTASSIVRLGAKPVFVDVNPDSYNIDASQIEQRVTEKTRAIIPVHLFGQVAQMKPIMEVAQRHNLFIIEDAAQAVGAVQDGTKCGNFGDLGCFSFYPSKNLGSFGDGGLVTTNNEELAEKVQILRNHGQNPTYFYKMIGGNFRLDGIQGAVLNVKLRYLDRWNERRRQNAALYDEYFTDSPIRPPKIDLNNLVSTINILLPHRKETDCGSFSLRTRLAQQFFTQNRFTCRNALVISVIKKEIYQWLNGSARRFCHCRFILNLHLDKSSTLRRRCLSCIDNIESLLW
jgi:dTDP-4-amino-4,6-dideoxygalactose transaminase